MISPRIFFMSMSRPLPCGREYHQPPGRGRVHWGEPGRRQRQAYRGQGNKWLRGDERYGFIDWYIQAQKSVRIIIDGSIPNWRLQSQAQCKMCRKWGGGYYFKKNLLTCFHGLLQRWCLVSLKRSKKAIFDPKLRNLTPPLTKPICQKKLPIFFLSLTFLQDFTTEMASKSKKNHFLLQKWPFLTEKGAIWPPRSNH